MKLISALLCILGGLIHAASPQTTVSISGEDFHINGKPTYPGRVWKGYRVESLLMNSWMVQAAYDDLNPDTAKRWAYADTGKWDAERNGSEFIDAMPEWKKHGLLAAAVAGHVSKGWFDFRRKGEAIEEGYQSPPVNWGISSPRKRGFFDYLGEITGAKSSASPRRLMSAP